MAKTNLNPWKKSIILFTNFKGLLSVRSLKWQSRWGITTLQLIINKKLLSKQIGLNNKYVLMGKSTILLRFMIKKRLLFALGVLNFMVDFKISLNVINVKNAFYKNVKLVYLKPTEMSKGKHFASIFLVLFRVFLYKKYKVKTKIS